MSLLKVNILILYITCSCQEILASTANIEKDFGFFLYRIKADGQTYPGLLLNNYLLVTNVRVADAKKVVICDVKGKSCETAVGTVETDDNKDYSFVKVLNKVEGNLVSEKIYTGELSMKMIKFCATIGYGHEPIKITIAEHTKITCPERCHHLDGVICGHKIVGVALLMPNGTILHPIKSLLEYGNEISGINALGKEMDQFERELGKASHEYPPIARSGSRSSLIGIFSEFIDNLLIFLF